MVFFFWLLVEAGQIINRNIFSNDYLGGVKTEK